MLARASTAIRDDAGMVDDVRLPAAAPPSRVSLFITCFNDTMFPQTGRAVVTLLERLGSRSISRSSRRAAARCTSTPATRRRRSRWCAGSCDAFADAEVVVSPSASCVGHGPRLLRARGRAVRRRRRSQREVDGDRAPGAGADRAARRPARRRGRGRVLPAPRHLSPHLPQPADAARRRPAAAAAARGRAASTWSTLPEADQCCGFGGTFAVKNADTSIAMLSDKVRTILDTGAEVCVSADNSCLMHIGGALSRQRAGVRTMHLAEILAQTEAGGGHVSGDGRSARRAVPFPEAARAALADTQLRHNLGHATHAIRAKRAAAVAELPDWEAAARGRPRAQGAGAAPPRRVPARARGVGAARRRQSCTGRATRRSATGSSATSSRRHGVDEVVKAKSLTTEETGLNEALAQRGIRAVGDRPGAADHPARRRRAVAHPGPGDPQEPRPDPRPVPRARCPTRRPTSPMTRASWPRRRARTCASCSWRRASGSAASTSPSPRPGRCRWSSPRATAGCARRCPRC